MDVSQIDFFLWFFGSHLLVPLENEETLHFYFLFTAYKMEMLRDSIQNFLFMTAYFGPGQIVTLGQSDGTLYLP